MNYRKLSEAEVKSLASALAGRFAKETPTAKEVRAHIKKFYPSSAASAVLMLNSEYNDSTYDNSVRCLVVYNQDGEEVAPLKEHSKTSRMDWSNFSLPNDSGGDEPTEDINIYVGNQPLPELYIKE